MSGLTLYRCIILPSALRRALPAYSNEVILMLHATTLAATATVPGSPESGSQRVFRLLPPLRRLWNRRRLLSLRLFCADQAIPKSRKQVAGLFTVACGMT